MKENINDSKTDTDVSPVVEKANDKKHDEFTFTPLRKDSESNVSNKSSNISSITQKIEQVNLDALVPFRNHPFEPYAGQRLLDMIESIRARGILSPIIVRPNSNGKYEILSGHNRVAAAKEAGFELVPAIVRKDLSDEEALLIVTETNLIQRSFADLKHSERAVALATHYEAMKKKPGYRSDLLQEIEDLTCSPVGNRLRTSDKLGAQYGLSKNTVARYLRVNKLIPALKERLDNDDIGMRVAEALSYLRGKEQKNVEKLLAKDTKISIKQADKLKTESEKGELDLTNISEILSSGYFTANVKPVKLSGQFLAQHFNLDQSVEEIEKVIAEALEQYFSNRNS